MEETVFESEERMSREEIAEYLRAVVEALDRGATITLTEGEQSVTVDPPGEATFEVEVEREHEDDVVTERSVEFEIEWDEVEGVDAASEDEQSSIE